jgi:hypothetical protein
MKKITLTLSLIAVALCLATANVSAADAKMYQVTGPVLEVKPTYIVMQKGDDKWQIAVDPATAASLKVGQKITVQYQMIAKKVTTK